MATGLHRQPPWRMGQRPRQALRGWAAYLTLYSAEKNAQIDGSARINLNNSDLQGLHDQLVEVLSEEEANFILAYRLYGPMASGNSQATEVQTESAAEMELISPSEPKEPVQQVLDLVGAKVQAPEPSNQGGQGGSSGGQGASSGQNNTQNRTIASPFSNDILSMATYLPTLMDACTIMDTEVIPGRINVNEAPARFCWEFPA